MKRTFLLVTATALLVVIPAQSMAASKTSFSKPKSAGRTGIPTTNTILSGTNAPTSAIGINGDFYIDTKNTLIYGPKTKGKWLAPTSLRGLSGASGVDGKNGSDAKNIINASSTVGPPGEKGEKGATGSIGATGAQGPAGAAGSGTGPAGAKGDTGLPGAAGTSGTNGINGSNGSAGIQGLPGLPGAKGDKGNAGADGNNGSPGVNGSKGETGTAGSIGERGATGPSTSYFVNIPAWTLSTSTSASSISTQFGALEADTSYFFQIILDGTFAIANAAAIYFSPEIFSTSTGAAIQTQVHVSDSKGSVNGVQSRHYMFNIIGTITTGHSSSKLQITMTDVVGVTGDTPLTIKGSALLNLVGQIG